MPTGPEATAIETAYEDQVQALFRVFFTNLAGDPGKEQQYFDNFKKGLNLAKHARDIALKAVP